MNLRDPDGATLRVGDLLIGTCRGKRDLRLIVRVVDIATRTTLAWVRHGYRTYPDMADRPFALWCEGGKFLHHVGWRKLNHKPQPVGGTCPPQGRNEIPAKLPTTETNPKGKPI